jgi:molecular chaperone GrpE
MTKKDKEHNQETSASHAADIPKEPAAGVDVQKELAELRAGLEALRKEKDDVFGRLQRVSADYANFQKRVPKQIADSVSYEKEVIIKSLLPVLDNFERTVDASTKENPDAVIKGVKIIAVQMLDILRTHGIEQIKAVNEKFDPVLHEAVVQQAVPEKENNSVLHELQKGYKLNGRVLRPSKVVVNKITSSQQTDDKQQDQKQKAADEFETTDVD